MTQRDDMAVLSAECAKWAKRPATFTGYHQFKGNGEGEAGFVQYGSFEVFHHDGDEGHGGETWLGCKPGWYWWPCFPGCLPDGEPSGPFPTAEGAYLDAIGE